MMFQKRVFRRISEPKRNGVVDWRNRQNMVLHNLCTSPCIIRMMKSRRMKWAEHVARMGRRGMHRGY
jgi:hypothetical protein